MSSATITRTPLTEHIGVELRGVDLDQPLTGPVREALHDAWVEFGLVLIRNALHSKEAHLGLSEVFGEMEPSATSFLNSVENPYLMELRQTPHNPKARRYIVNGEERIGYIGWHWDQAFMPTIVRGAVLRMVQPAGAAGSTGFIDGIAAYGRLSEETKARIDSLEVVYEFNPAMEQNPGFPRDVVSLNGVPGKRNFPPVVHPLVITQPETGRKVLKLSPTHVRYVLGMDKDESDALIAELADVLTEDEYAYYHAWGPDDVIIWDNWRVIHSAAGVPEGVSRYGIRTTIAGDYDVGRYLDPGLDKNNPPDRFDD
ncbi:MAG TPA: TauD/TfdA family dioxygenase [Actinomycetes bacterium]|jgi:taurine dioxygenase|nr:TauD/TfdA family dioxygenase [Actinomycetes bacterium]